MTLDVEIVNFLANYSQHSAWNCEDKTAESGLDEDDRSQ